MLSIFAHRLVTRLGYWADGEGYFVKNKSDSVLSGLDFRNGTEAVMDDEYSTYIYGNETLRLLWQYVAEDTEDPFFLYFASQAVHHPFDAPQHLLDHFEQRIGSGQRAKCVIADNITNGAIQTRSNIKYKECTASSVGME